MKFSTFFTYTFIIIISTSTLSCSNTNDEKIYTSGIAGNTTKVKLSQQDLNFMVKAYSLGLLKINLANEAQIRSTSAESSQLGRAISLSHTGLNTQMEEIAEEHGFTLFKDLTDEQKLVWKQLVKEKGWNFDKKFNEILQQIKKEEQVLLDEVQKSNSTETIKLLAHKSQTELQLHDVLKQTLQQKIDEKTMIAVSDEDPKEKDSKKKKKSSVAKS